MMVSVNRGGTAESKIAFSSSRDEKVFLIKLIFFYPKTSRFHRLNYQFELEKIMLPKTFDYKTAETRLYKYWEDNGFFKPENDPNLPGHDPTKKPYVISIPPPNVTGILHLGHVLFVSLEDLMIRHQRMKGIPTLWVPGTDHAGIATQLVVENKLKEQGTSREEIGRNSFLEETWQWKEEHGGVIVEQIRRLGASCDWDRERFTLDEGLSRAVREAFVHLYDKGLIYRGPRLVNWSPHPANCCF